MKLDRCECTNFLAVEYMAVDVTGVTGLDVTGNRNFNEVLFFSDIKMFSFLCTK